MALTSYAGGGQKLIKQLQMQKVVGALINTRRGGWAVGVEGR